MLPYFVVEIKSPNNEESGRLQAVCKILRKTRQIDLLINRFNRKSKKEFKLKKIPKKKSSV